MQPAMDMWLGYECSGPMAMKRYCEKFANLQAHSST